MATFQITGPDGKKYRVTGENPAGAMQALRKMLGEASTPTGHQNVPEFNPGVEGYDPATGEVTPEYGMLGSAARGAADAVTMGFGDELASYPASWATGQPRAQVLAEMRGLDQQAQTQNPGSYMGGQVAGGVAMGLAAGPATLSGRAAASTLGPRILAGAGDGAIFGGLHGAGTGEDAASRVRNAVTEALIGTAAGGAFPAVSAGLGKAYSGLRDYLKTGPIAKQAGASPEAMRLLEQVMNADGSLGPQGQSSMVRAGGDAMLADAGPNARAVLDTAIQRGGPGAIDARNAITARTDRAGKAVNDALDNTLGAPQGVTAARTSIRQGSASARSSAYDEAYNAAIDYADPRGQSLEKLIKGRVPSRVIADANELMRLDGDESRQILAKVADDGSVTFEKLPDVRQIDYITRALNQAAESGDGAGALGGQTPKGRAYQNLAKEIRDTARDLVPEYGKALETAADPIRRSKAVELGSKLLSPSMTRDQVDEAVQGMTGPEKAALAQGVRSRLDDMMANVTRTVQDGDTPAREAIKAIKDMSSRANREKLTAAIGKAKADKLFDEIDRAAMSFDLRASVADNSKTYARLATDQMVKDTTGPGVIGKAAQGEPINAGKRVVQALTGMTPEKVRGKEDAVYSEIARLLTRGGGAGKTVYDGINKLGQTDQATRLMASRISRALLGPRYAYPTTTQIADRLQE